MDSVFWCRDSSSSLVTQGPRRRKRAGLDPIRHIFPRISSIEGLTIAQIRDMNSKLLGLLGQTEHGTCDCKENSSCIVCDWVPREGRGADAVLRNVHEISGNAIRALIRHEFEDHGCTKSSSRGFPTYVNLRLQLSLAACTARYRGRVLSVLAACAAWMRPRP